LTEGTARAGRLSASRPPATDRPHAVPLYNVYSQLVYALKGSDVGDVMVNGKLIVRNRQMLTVDARAVLAKAAAYGLSVSKSLKGN